MAGVNSGSIWWWLGILAAFGIVATAGLPGVLLVAILCGLPLRARKRVSREVLRASHAAYVVLGWSIGSRLERDAVLSLAARAPQIGIALGAILMTAALMAIVLHRGFGFSARSAFVATAPGGLPELASTATLDDVDLSAVMPVHVTRVVILLVLLPTILAVMA